MFRQGNNRVGSRVVQDVVDGERHLLQPTWNRRKTAPATIVWVSLRITTRDSVEGKNKLSVYSFVGERVTIRELWI